MTVTALDIVSVTYLPNGATTDFAFEFQVDTESDVAVMLDGLVVDPALYSVELNDDGTGEVSFFNAPTGDELYLAAEPAFGQPTSLQNQGPFFQRVIERAHLAGLVGAAPARATMPPVAPPALLRPLAEYEAVVGGAW